MPRTKKPQQPLPKSESELQKEKYQARIRELFRELLGGITLKEIRDFDKLEGQERIEFAKFCHVTYHNSFFSQIIDALYLPQIMYAARQAENYDQVSYNRASANGAELVREFFQKWANIYDSEFGERGKFDPHKSFEPTPNN